MIEVLGPARVDGTTVRSRGQRVLLAALALDLDRVVSGDRLAELIWGDELPVNRRGALQSHVSRLRRQLPSGVDVAPAGDGYRLVVGDHRLDIQVLVEASARTATAVDPADRIRMCDEGLAVCVGVPFADLDDSRAIAERSRLVEIADELRDRRAGALIEIGRLGDAIAELESMRSADPLRERTVEQLMRALVAAGRKGDALLAYSELNDRLVEELGLDPDPALRALRDAIVTETYVPSERLPDASDANRHDAHLRTRVGPSLDDLVGRRVELERLVDLLQTPGVVTIVGPGGVGKTRLAFQIARPDLARFGRVDVVELAQLTDAAALADAVASELGLTAESGADAAARVAGALRSQRRLLVLDNCEHVIDPVARFVDHLLRAGDEVHVLATSREPLNVHRESVLRLTPLDDDEGRELLGRRLEARGCDRPTGETAVALVRQITRAVDGLPLGIELAAAHGETMTLHELADALREPLELLHRGRRTSDERHRSLRSLVEWSVRDLTPAQRDVFARTAVFAGPFSAGALSVVAARPPAEAAMALADLVDRSLVVSEAGPGGRMLHSTMATVRAFAAELLDESGRRADAEERHARWVLGLVETMAADLGGWRNAELTRVVDVHLPDLRVAHRRFVGSDDAERSIRFAASLHHVAVYRMHAELFAWITESAERFGDRDVPGTEAVLASAAVGAWEVGAMERSSDLALRAERAVTPSLGRGIGAPEALADLAGFRGDHAEAIELYGTGLAAARTDGNPAREFGDLADVAIHHAYTGDLRAATDRIVEARALLHDEGPQAASAWLAYVEGEALAETDPDAALVALRRAIDDAVASSSDFIIGVARLTLAGLEIRVGDLDAAAGQLGTLIRHWRQAGARLQQWITLRTVLALLVARGDDVPAARTLGVLETEQNPAEIDGADAERLAEAHRALVTRVPQEEHGAWLDRDLDEIVDDLLAILDGGRTFRDASTS